MSTIFKLAAIGAVSIAALATSAQAQSRYGDIMAYEGGATNCDPAACAATSVESSRYGSVETVQPVHGAAPVMVDCSVYGNMPCGPQVVAQPTTVYTQQVQTYTAEPVNCPVGTMMQADGSCMQSSSTYSSSTTYSAPAMTADCPAGTTMQPDGTCLQGSSYSSTTTYTAPAPVMTVNCPVGTTKQPDGTCAQTATVYSGDATPSYGYESSTTYGADAYRPIRK